MNAREQYVRETILHRRSVRKYANKPIPHADLLELVEAGAYAPSGSNWQTQRFLLIDQPNEIKRFFEIKQANGVRFDTAAALICVFSDASLARVDRPIEKHVWEVLRIQDTAAAIQNILLLATAKGIASCWVSLGPRMSGKRMLRGKHWRDLFPHHEIPASYEPQGVVTLGYPLRTDENGWPKGYAKHGFINSPVPRESVEHYMIERKK